MDDDRFEGSRFHLPALAIIICLGLIAYSNTFLSPFHLDDKTSIIDNQAIRNLSHLQDIWNFLPRRFVLYLSLAVNYHFGQLHVFGYHLFNLAIHLSSAAFVYWFVLLTFSTPALKNQDIAKFKNFIAAFSALIFVSHPIQTQAVTYIVQRAASMSTLFYIASLCLYIRSRLVKKRASFFYIASILLGIVCMFTKEIGITLPLILWIYEMTFLRKGNDTSWKRFAPFLFMILIIPLTMLITERGRAPEMGAISPLTYFLTQLKVVCAYIGLLFLPLHQTIDHDIPISKTIFEPATFLSLLCSLGILWWIIRIYVKHRLLCFSVLWFFVTLLPESSFLPIQDVMVEHRLYLPSVGFSLFVTSGLFYLLKEISLKIAMIILTLIVLIFSLMTFERNMIWKDDLSLWDEAVHQSPHKARPYTNRGSNYGQRGNFALAIADFNRAIDLDPRNLESYDNRGMMYFAQGNLIQAIEDFNKEIEINPHSASAYNNRGFIYYTQGNFDQALLDFNKAIEIYPHYARPYNNRALIEYAQGRLSEALEDENRATSLDPQFEEAYNNRGMIHAKQGEFNQAIADYDKAIEDNPLYGRAYFNRAWVYGRLNENSRALNDINQARVLGIPKASLEELLREILSKNK